jgi:hypothetical protein
VLEPVDGAARRGAVLVEHGEQRVERPRHGEAQELLLAADVVVDRRLRAPGGLREVLHAGRVVAALEELAATTSSSSSRLYCSRRSRATRRGDVTGWTVAPGLTRRSGGRR